MTAAGLLIAVSGCGASGPDQVLNEDELASLYPTGDAVPGDLEMTDDVDASEYYESQDEWEESVRGVADADPGADGEGAEECSAAQQESVEAFQEILENADDNIDYSRTDATASYEHSSGAYLSVYVYSAHPDTWPEPDTWLEESLACLTVEDGYDTAEEVEEASLGDAIGYEARLADGPAEWQTVLHDGIDYLSVDLHIDHDEPMDEDLAAAAEALFDHIMEQAEAVEH